MAEEKVLMMEELFIRDIGVPRLEFYRLLEEDSRRLLEFVEEESNPEDLRALASRALAYLIQDNDVIPDDKAFGHVDDYVIILVAFDELFPGEISQLSAEALLEALPLDVRTRVVEAMELVLKSKDFFPPSALKKPLEKEFEHFRKRRDQPRSLWSLAVLMLPEIFLKGLLESAGPRDEYGRPMLERPGPVLAVLFFLLSTVIIGIVLVFQN